MIFIPYQELSPETLQALLESFVMREGTDYGEQELSLDAKIFRLKKQVEKGGVLITFDPETESCNLVLKGDVSAL